MRKVSRRTARWTAAAALAVSMFAPSVANAQQSGLLPLAPIRRQRVDCQNEDPIYRMYRHEYFGYHPTCWRRFPAGWGCPSPEAPNAAQAFKELPRDQPSNEAGADDMPGPDGAANPPAGGAAAPGDMNANPPAGPAGQPNPNALPPLPSGGRSPFDIDTPPAGGNANPPAAPPADNTPSPPPAERPAAPGVGISMGGPALPPVAESAGAPETLAPAVTAPAAAPEQPILSLPDPTANGANAPVIPGSNVAPPPGPLVPPTGAMIDPNTGGPFQAPRRTSMLGNLFSGRLFRR